MHDLSIGELIKKLQQKDGKKIRLTIRRGIDDSKISIQIKEKSLIVGQHAFFFFKRNFRSNDILLFELLFEFVSHWRK